MGAFIDLIGQRFGKLTVKERTDNQGILIKWVCLCDCGNKTIASTKKLRNGRKRSCGCLWLPAVKTAKTKHGHAADGRISPELNIWMGMRRRCNCPTDESYGNYGGRGIKVCSRWDDFSVFLSDMGPRPSPKHTIDRIDNNGDYEPDNCRWATQAEQNRNTRSNVRVIFGGEEMCAVDAARIAGLKYGTLIHRIKAGWPAEELFVPVRKNKP